MRRRARPSAHAGFASVQKPHTVTIPALCRQAAQWRDAQPGREPVRMSVNLSARQVARSDVAGCVRRILATTGLDAGLLDLEITEHALLADTDHTVAAARSRLPVRAGLPVRRPGAGR